MLWWAWIITGAILLGAELAFIDAQFYLVFLGISALIVGVVGAAGIDWAPWLQWLTFGVLSVVSMMTFRRSIYRRLRGHPPTVQAGPAGDVLVLSAALPPGESCQVEFRGSFWTATNAGDEAIAAGGRAKVIRVHGLTLLVRPDA